MTELLEIRLPNTPNKKIGAFLTYKLYVLYATHFRKNFDVVHFNWKSLRITSKSYKNRKDKIFFEKISENYTIYDQIVLYISNFLANKDYWSGSLISLDAVDFYRNYKMRYESITKCYTNDLVNLCLFCNLKEIKFNKLFDIINNQHPAIFKLLQQDIISYETFLLLDAAIPFINDINIVLVDDIVWNSYYKRINAYNKLLLINKEKAKNITLSVVKENIRK